MASNGALLLNDKLRDSKVPSLSLCTLVVKDVDDIDRGVQLGFQSSTSAWIAPTAVV